MSSLCNVLGISDSACRALKNAFLAPLRGGLLVGCSDDAGKGATVDVYVPPIRDGGSGDVYVPPTPDAGDAGFADAAQPEPDCDKDNDGFVDIACRYENFCDEYQPGMETWDNLCDCDDTSPEINPQAAERCNGRDDNCINGADEGFDIGEVCEVGVGECYNVGRKICEPNGLSTICSANPLPASPEVPCNNIDEDCNGVVFHGTDQDGDRFKTEGGLCGPVDCNDNNAAVNSRAREICNGIDDNCDGNTDDIVINVSGRRIDGEGSVYAAQPTIFWNSDHYDVFWEDANRERRGLYLTRLDPCGEKMDNDIRLIDEGVAVGTAGAGYGFSEGEKMGTIVRSDFGYAIAWMDENRRVIFSRFNLSGEEVGEETVIDEANASIVKPVLLLDDGGYSVFWKAGSVRFVRLDPDGERTGDNIEVVNNAISFNIAHDGDGYGMVWSLRTEDSITLNFARFTSNGERIGEEMLIANYDTAIELNSDVHWNGEGYDLFWTRYFRVDGRDQRELWFTGITNEGGLIRTSQISSEEQRPSCSEITKVIAKGDGEYHVFWPSDTMVFTNIKRGDENDIMIESSAIELPNGGKCYAQIEWTGEEYGILWGMSRGGDTHVYFGRLDASGRMIANSFRNVDGDSWAVTQKASLKWNGTGYGIAWDAQYWWVDNTSRIHFAAEYQQQCAFECLFEE